VIALPTDACYVLACQLDDKAAVERLRALRGLDDKHLLTLMCRDLSELSVYAQVDNRQYRFLRDWTPGPFTFVLPATKEVPRRLWHPSRKTIGLRVPLVAGGQRPAGRAGRTRAVLQPDPSRRRAIRCTKPTKSSSGWRGASMRCSMPAATAFADHGGRHDRRHPDGHADGLRQGRRLASSDGRRRLNAPIRGLPLESAGHSVSPSRPYRQGRLPCLPNESSPACAPPARCTWAITTAP
jgi:hypothetical protein